MAAPTPLAAIPCDAEWCQEGYVEWEVRPAGIAAESPDYRSRPCEECEGRGTVDESSCDICGNDVEAGTAYEVVTQPTAGPTTTLIACLACKAESLDACGFCWRDASTAAIRRTGEYRRATLPCSECGVPICHRCPGDADYSPDEGPSVTCATCVEKAGRNAA